MAFIRDFWQSWPNAISAKLVNTEIQMSVELFPKGGDMLNYGGTPDPSGVYWLDGTISKNYNLIISNMYTKSFIFTRTDLSPLPK
jgi:hypothetical protein